MGVFFIFTLNIVNKGLKISKIFLEKSIKVGPRDQNGALMAMFVLGLSEANDAKAKWGCEQGIIHPISAQCHQIIFILLTNVVAVYVRFSWIYF